MKKYNYVQEMLIKGLKEHFGENLILPEFNSEEDVRNFIQQYSDNFVWIYDGLYIDYRTKVNIPDSFFGETGLEETELSIELGLESMADILDFDFSERDFYKINNLEVPEELINKWKKQDEEYEKQREEEEANYWKEQEEIERLYWEQESRASLNTYNPGDDFETDWINSLE